MVIFNLDLTGRTPYTGSKEPVHHCSYMKNLGYYVLFGGEGERDSDCHQFLKCPLFKEQKNP